MIVQWRNAVLEIEAIPLEISWSGKTCDRRAERRDLQQLLLPQLLLQLFGQFRGVLWQCRFLQVISGQGTQVRKYVAFSESLASDLCMTLGKAGDQSTP